MNAEATLEHARLTLARQLTSNSLTAGLDRSGDVERHALVTFAKRRVVRCRLGSQVLMVFRCVAQEDSGQAVGSHLIPVKVQLTRDLPWSVETLDMLGTLVTNDRAHNQWISSTLAIHEAFWKTRLARERSIAAMREQVAGDGLQMGLFDLRAEHTWIEEQARRHTEVLENRWATSVATQRATLRAESPRLALVLLTR